MTEYLIAAVSGVLIAPLLQTAFGRGRCTTAVTWTITLVTAAAIAGAATAHVAQIVMSDHAQPGDVYTAVQRIAGPAIAWCIVTGMALWRLPARSWVRLLCLWGALSNALGLPAAVVFAPRQALVLFVAWLVMYAVLRVYRKIVDTPTG